MSTATINHDANALLVFSVGPVLCCAPTLTVEAVIMPPPIHKTPGSNRDHPGVFRYSSGMVSVVDLRQRFGVEEELWQSPGRIIVTEITGGHAGFLVDAIIDVMLWPEQGWGVTPPLVPRDVFSRTLMLDGQIHLYADFDHLFKFRESGYLRAHIAGLIEKQKHTAMQSPTSNAANLARPTPVVETIAHTQMPDKARPEPVVNTTAMPVPVLVKKNSSTRMRDQLKEIRQTAASSKLNKASTSVVPDRFIAKQIVENKQVETVAITPAAALSHSGNESLDTGNETSGKLVMAVFMVLLLLAGILLVASFNQPGLEPDITPVDASVARSDGGQEIRPAADAEPSYQADISQDAEGIVITLDEVDSEALNQQPISAWQSVASTAMDTPAEVLPAPPAENTVIIHIVKQGDTLWDIASHYVRDPWRYPELAKLSSIKNPHRIYPGNKVKIIIRSAGKKKQDDSN